MQILSPFFFVKRVELLCEIVFLRVQNTKVLVIRTCVR